jgi:F0F1-type ATP synthase epsilon subunit
VVDPDQQRHLLADVLQRAPLALALVDAAVDVREIDPDEARRQLETAREELERVERGESEADRWQLEQRIRHAENQLNATGRA